MHICISTINLRREDMDWGSVNFDWNHARAFLLSAEQGSLSAAARLLNTSQPTLRGTGTGTRYHPV
ncbi:LysR family transcriptional regulator [Thalassolituus pacificus]|uniref:LysR family transcriptional regulator n=1 Tax=Thalassolituus pacificus TaxID=2975440 RepID=UPI003B846B81